MQPNGGIDGYTFYYCDITLAEGLYWFSFRYTSDYGEFKVTKTEHSLGVVSDKGTDWQLTVYTADFETPDWLDGGIIYQIFPDRFYNSGAEKVMFPPIALFKTIGTRSPNTVRQQSRKPSVTIISVGILRG